MPQGEIYIVDPDRGQVDEFSAAMVGKGFQVEREKIVERDTDGVPFSGVRLKFFSRNADL